MTNERNITKLNFINCQKNIKYNFTSTIIVVS